MALAKFDVAALSPHATELQAVVCAYAKLKDWNEFGQFRTGKSEGQRESVRRAAEQIHGILEAVFPPREDEVLAVEVAAISRELIGRR